MKRGTDQVHGDTGDDTVVLRVVAAWCESAEAALASPRGPHAAHVGRQPDGAWLLALAVQRHDEAQRRQRHFVDVAVGGVLRADRWSLVKLGPGVWDVSPSVVVPGQIHAFVTLVGVPEPAPWEGT